MYKDHSEHDWLICKCSDKQNDPQCRETGHEVNASIPRLFHARNQSSRLFIVAGQSPSFWWQTRRSNCRNDPVKCDLDWRTIRVAFYVHRTSFLFECQCSFWFCFQLVAVDDKYMVGTGDFCGEMPLLSSSNVTTLFKTHVAWRTRRVGSFWGWIVRYHWGLLSYFVILSFVVLLNLILFSFYAGTVTER